MKKSDSKNSGFNTPRLVGSKPAKKPASVLPASMTSKLDALNARLAKPVVSTVTQMTEQTREQVLPVMILSGQQLGQIMSADNFGDMIAEKSEIEQDVVDVVKASPSHIQMELALACLTEAWNESPQDSRALMNITGLAVDLGVFRENEQGHYLPIYDKDLRRLCSKRFATSADALGLLRTMASVQNSIYTERKHGVEEEIKALQDRATTAGLIDAIQKGGVAWFRHFYNRRPGTALVEVKNIVKDEETGIVDCEFVPLQGLGSAKKPIDGAKELPPQVVIKLSMLSDDKLRLNETIPSDEFAKALSFWHMLRDAVKSAKQNQQVREEADAFKAKATLTAEEFFTTKKVGTFALYHPRWVKKDRKTGKVTATFKHVLWLVERDKDGKIRVAETNANKGSQELYELDSRVIQWMSPENVLYPLNALLSTAKSYYENGLESTQEDKQKQQANLRAQEAQAELEAQRERIAKAEAERVANQG